MDYQTLPVELARNRIVSTADAADFIGVDVQLFRKMIKRGSVPAPIQLSERVRGFRIGDLSDWVSARAAERGAP